MPERAVTDYAGSAPLLLQAKQRFCRAGWGTRAGAGVVLQLLALAIAGGTGQVEMCRVLCSWGTCYSSNTFPAWEHLPRIQKRKEIKTSPEEE